MLNNFWHYTKWCLVSTLFYLIEGIKYYNILTGFVYLNGLWTVTYTFLVKWYFSIGYRQIRAAVFIGMLIYLLCEQVYKITIMTIIIVINVIFPPPGEPSWSAVTYHCCRRSGVKFEIPLGERSLGNTNLNAVLWG